MKIREIPLLNVYLLAMKFPVIEPKDFLQTPSRKKSDIEERNEVS